MIETPNNKSESFEEKAEAELIIFINERSLTIDEVKGSYYRSCGMDEGEVEVYNQELLDRMKEMADEGFPLNRFAELITKLQETEHTLAKFNSIIEELSVSDNEKRVLTSIVEQGRKGELEFLIDSKEVIRMDINAVLPPEVVADSMLKAIVAVTERIGEQNKELAIQFSEE